jgi:hypothetical protein
MKWGFVILSMAVVVIITGCQYFWLLRPAGWRELEDGDRWQARIGTVNIISQSLICGWYSQGAWVKIRLMNNGEQVVTVIGTNIVTSQGSYSQLHNIGEPF